MFVEPKKQSSPSPPDRGEWQHLIQMLRESARADEERGISLLDERGGQEFRSYGQILDAALRAGQGLRERG
ncbi:MAG: hypothetical protein ACNA8W_25780, partial [Bradymonadaceae bacterium]